MVYVGILPLPLIKVFFSTRIEIKYLEFNLEVRICPLSSTRLCKLKENMVKLELKLEVL